MDLRITMDIRFVQEIDFTSIHLYPDYWATGNLTFQLQFTAQYIAGHMAESAGLQKPLIISEVGKYPPLAARNTHLKYLYGIAASSAASNGALAGKIPFQLRKGLMLSGHYILECSYSIHVSQGPESVDQSAITKFDL